MFKHTLLAGCFMLSMLCSVSVMAESNITFLKSKYNDANIPADKINQIVKQNFDIAAFREIKVQFMHNDKHQVDHLLIYLFSKTHHLVEFSRMNIDANFNVISIQNNYHLSKSDYDQQPGISVKEAKCPDESIEFIAFAPNDWDLEQDITKDVAKSAKAHSLKTVSLLIKKATRSNYLNYMACPKLKGNFYDGDADPEVITTVDGVITYGDIDAMLHNQFRYKVTNIWLACQAYNDPIKTSVIDIAQSQKYAAGITDLEVGPSDRAAACAMKAAMDGKPMTAAFDACYLQYDTSEDKWGFGGHGADLFGT